MPEEESRKYKCSCGSRVVAEYLYFEAGISLRVTDLVSLNDKRSILPKEDGKCFCECFLCGKPLTQIEELDFYEELWGDV